MFKPAGGGDRGAHKTCPPASLPPRVGARGGWCAWVGRGSGAGGSRLQEGRGGRRPPQIERQARGELVGRKGNRGATGSALPELEHEEKSRRCEDRRDDGLNAGREIELHLHVRIE